MAVGSLANGWVNLLGTGLLPLRPGAPCWTRRVRDGITDIAAGHYADNHGLGPGAGKARICPKPARWVKLPFSAGPDELGAPCPRMVRSQSLRYKHRQFYETDHPMKFLDQVKGLYRCPARAGRVRSRSGARNMSSSAVLMAAMADAAAMCGQRPWTGSNTLIDYRYQQHFKAQRGINGGGRKPHRRGMAKTSS